MANTVNTFNLRKIYINLKSARNTLTVFIKLIFNKDGKNHVIHLVYAPLF